MIKIINKEKIMEYRDLYDKNRNLIGKILVVVCFMENSKGKFLMQKRSVQKNGLCGTTMN